MALYYYRRFSHAYTVERPRKLNRFILYVIFDMSKKNIVQEEGRVYALAHRE